MNEMQQWNDLAAQPRIVNFKHQGQNGVGHFNYFDNSRQLSFQWDGSMNEEVTVSHGGYGEPVLWCFTAREFQHEDVIATLDVHDLMQVWATYFKRMCDEWIRDVEEGMANEDFDNTPVIL